MPKLSREDAETTLRRFLTNTQELREVLLILRRPPDGIDEQLLGEGFVAGVGRASWHVARASHQLPPGAIRAALEKLAEAKHVTAFFLRGAVDAGAGDEALQGQWSDALRALLDMQTTYAWGSKQRKAKVAGLAQNPRFLSAIQTAAVGANVIGLDALAVLAHDGSDASMDALMAQVERVSTRPAAGLAWLERLETHAKDTPAIRAMFEQIRVRLTAQRQRSPAMLLAAQIGLGDLPDFWFDLWLGSVERNANRVPRLQLSASVRSAPERWFHVSLSQLDDDLRSGRHLTSSFSSEKTIRDDFELGAPLPAELPQWLAAAAQKLKAEWSWADCRPRTNLRGKKRGQLNAWLRGV